MPRAHEVGGARGVWGPHAQRRRGDRVEGTICSTARRRGHAAPARRPHAPWIAARILRRRSPPPLAKGPMRQTSRATILLPALALFALHLGACAQGVVDDGAPVQISADLLLTGTATASSVEGTGLEAAKAVDGSTTTRWSSAF